MDIHLSEFAAIALATIAALTLALAAGAGLMAWRAYRPSRYTRRYLARQRDLARRAQARRAASSAAYR